MTDDLSDIELLGWEVISKMTKPELLEYQKKLEHSLDIKRAQIAWLKGSLPSPSNAVH